MDQLSQSTSIKDGLLPAERVALDTIIVIRSDHDTITTIVMMITTRGTQDKILLLLHPRTTTKKEKRTIIKAWMASFLINSSHQDSHQRTTISKTMVDLAIVIGRQ